MTDVNHSGNGAYTVVEGDCLISIAAAHGFFWETLWEHPDNAALKDARRDAMVLLPGDRVAIPQRELKREPGATAEKHSFRVRGVPAKVRLRFCRDGDPLAGEKATVEIAGRTEQQKTDGDGFLEVAVPPGATTGTVTIGEGDDRTIYALELGRLNPADSIIGAKQRLNNLGRYDGPITGIRDEGFSAALQDFQAEHELQIDGSLSSDTAAKLEEVHGS